LCKELNLARNHMNFNVGTNHELYR
jgi:hypothetical protein